MRSVTTDSNGHFTFLAVTPDTYDLSVVRLGYRTLLLPSGATASAGEVTYLKVLMQRQLKTVSIDPGTFSNDKIGYGPGKTLDEYVIRPRGSLQDWRPSQLLLLVPGVVVIGGPGPVH